MKKIIIQNPLFCGMSEQELENALKALDATKSEYCKNEILVAAGGRLVRFGLVLSGKVEVCFTDIDGNEALMASVSEGDTFGESLCWLTMNDIPVTVTAVSEVSVLWLSPERLRSNDSSDTVHNLRNRFLSMLAGKTLAMNDRIQILAKPTIREKLIVFLSQCSVKNGSKTFSVPFDRETMARYLGVNRAALSRELSTMQKEGIIEFYRNSFKIL